MTTFTRPAAPAKPTVCSLQAEKVIAACERNWSIHQANCSGFAVAVARDLGAILTGQADNIVDYIDRNWWLVQSGREAADWAEGGFLVLAGLKSTDHVPARSNGHVAVVVAGPVAHGKYPSAYWGSLGSVGAKMKTLNFSWNRSDRDNVIYRAMHISP